MNYKNRKNIRMEKAESLINKYLKKYKLYDSIEKNKILIEWSSIIGNEYDFLNPLYFENNMLICKITDINLQNKAKDEKYRLKNKINNYFGKELIEDIKFVK